jgi:hypothetical protein
MPYQDIFLAAYLCIKKKKETVPLQATTLTHLREQRGCGTYQEKFYVGF